MELSRNFRANKTFRCSELFSYVLEKKDRNRPESKKRKLNRAVQVLQDVSDTFSELKDFMDKKLEQKCASENTSLEDVICLCFVVTLTLHWQ